MIGINHEVMYVVQLQVLISADVGEFGNLEPSCSICGGARRCAGFGMPTFGGSRCAACGWVSWFTGDKLMILSKV